MKVSLVVPDFLSGTSFLQQPIDFLYTATILGNMGFETSVIDCRVNHISFSMLTDMLKDSDLAIVTTTPCDQVQNYFLDYRYAYAVHTINYVKSTLPTLPVAVCGAHVSVRPDLVAKEVKCDYYILGEVIEIAGMLARAIQTNGEIDSVPNIFRVANGEIINNRFSIEYYHPILDDTIFPDYSKVAMQSYFGVKYVNNVPIRRANRAVIQGGRGCPYNCLFCHNYYGKNINRRSAESVAIELFMCQNQHGIEEIFFLDEVFTMDKNWLIQLANQIEKYRIKLELTIQTRVDHIDVEILYLLKQIGVKNIWIGLESANDDVLSFSQKGIKISMVNDVIEQIRAAGMNPNAFFMLGMPGETIDTLNSTIREIYESKIPYTRSLMICTPRYNTQLYLLAKQQYPYVEDHWFNLNAVKGLVANKMTPSIIQQAKTILKDRNFLYEASCPQIKY